MARFHPHALFRFAQRRVDLFSEEDRMNPGFVKSLANNSFEKGVVVSRTDVEEFLGHRIKPRSGDRFYLADRDGAGIWIAVWLPTGAQVAMSYLTPYFPVEEEEIEAAIRALTSDGAELVS